MKLLEANQLPDHSPAGQLMNPIRLKLKSDQLFRQIESQFYDSFIKIQTQTLLYFKIMQVEKIRKEVSDYNVNHESELKLIMKEKQEVRSQIDAGVNKLARAKHNPAVNQSPVCIDKKSKRVYALINDMPDGNFHLAMENRPLPVVTQEKKSRSRGRSVPKNKTDLSQKEEVKQQALFSPRGTPVAQADHLMIEAKKSSPVSASPKKPASPKKHASPKKSASPKKPASVKKGKTSPKK